MLVKQEKTIKTQARNVENYKFLERKRHKALNQGHRYKQKSLQECRTSLAIDLGKQIKTINYLALASVRFGTGLEN